MRFRRAPVAGAAVAFAVGIGVARVQGWWDFQQPVVVLIGALVLLVGVWLVAMRWGVRVCVFPVLAVWVVLGMGAAGWRVSAPVSARFTTMGDGLRREVRGRVVRVREAEPVVGGAEKDADGVAPWEMTEDLPGEQAAGQQGGRGRATVVDVAVEEMEEVTREGDGMVAATGGVRMSVYGEAGVRCGDEVEFEGRLRTPVRYRDDGVFEVGNALERDGVELTGYTSGLRVVGTGAAGWGCRVKGAQAWASGRMMGFVASGVNGGMPRWLRLERADGEMLDAMLFGDRAGLSHALRRGFERTGTFHLFVVSGLHIALLAGVVWWGMRKLRAVRWLATLVTICAAGGYAVVTGFGQPAQRALVMVSVYLVARLLNRETDVLNALGAAVLALLVWQPGSLFEASFQMTALAIVAIGGIAVPLGEWSVLRYAKVARGVFRVWGRGEATRREAGLRLVLELWGEEVAAVVGDWGRRAPARVVTGVAWVGELALVGVVAELVMVLPMAEYFHRAAVFGVPANMLVIPLIGVLAPAGVLTFLGSLVSPWVAVVPGAVTAGLLHLVRLGIGRVNGLGAADWRVPGPVWWVGLGAVLAWVGCCWLVRRGRWGAWVTVFVLPCVAAVVLWPEPVVYVPGRLEVTSIDVGQGDSALVVRPDGVAMVVDAGGPVGSHGVAEVVSRFDVGEEVVSNYLWSRRVRRVDVVVLSHAHTDHMGGMPAVLRNFRPRELWVSVDTDSALYRALLAEAAELGVRVRHLAAGDALDWGGVGVEVLAPARGYGHAGAPKNDDSLVVELGYGKSRVLLEGDAEKASEAAMVASGRLTPVTLLKVGHHGSVTSSGDAFLAAVRPKDAVVSVGRRNTFGHPREEVIGRFAGLGTRFYRTDLMGARTFLLDGEGNVEER